MTAIGATGCTLYTGAELSFPLAAAGGVATWSIPIPDNPSLLQQTFFTQGLILGDPVNPAQLVARTRAEGWSDRASGSSHGRP